MNIKIKAVSALAVIAIIIGGYLLISTGEKMEFNPQLLDSFIRISVIDKLYADNPDSAKALIKLILAEENVPESDLTAFEIYLKSNPDYFLDFLDSIKSKLDSCLSMPRYQLDSLIYPKGYKSQLKSKRRIS